MPQLPEKFKSYVASQADLPGVERRNAVRWAQQQDGSVLFPTEMYIFDPATNISVEFGAEMLKLATGNLNLGGGVSFATVAEVAAGTSTTAVISPFTLRSNQSADLDFVATDPGKYADRQTIAAYVQANGAATVFATGAEVIAGTATAKAISPATLHAWKSPNIDFATNTTQIADRATIAAYVTTRLPVKSTTPVALTGTDDATFITPLTLRAVLNAEPDEGLLDGALDLAASSFLPQAEPGDWFRVGTTATIGGVIFTADEWYKNETGVAIGAGNTNAIAAAWTKTKDAGAAPPVASDGTLIGGSIDLATTLALPAGGIGDFFRVGTTATVGGRLFTADEWYKNETGVAIAAGATVAIAAAWTLTKPAGAVASLSPTIVPYTAHGQAIGAINTFVPFAASYDPDGAGFDDGAGGTTSIHLTDGEFAVDPAGAYILDGGGAKIPAPHNVVVVSVPSTNSLGIVSGEKAGGIANAVGFTVPAGLKRAHTYYVQPDGTTGEPYTEFPLFQVDEDAATVIRFHQDSGLGVASSGAATTTHTPVSRRCETGNDCEVALDNDTTIVNAFVPAATTAAIEKTIQITHSRFGALVRGIDYAVAANDADLTWLKPASPLLATDVMEINYIV